MTTTVASDVVSSRDVWRRHGKHNIRSSTPTIGFMWEGHGEYHVERGGVIIHSRYNVREFQWLGLVDDKVHYRAVDKAGNVGAFVTYTYVCDQTYDYEQFVDAVSGNSGNAGTSAGAPVQTGAQAKTNMAANLGAGQTGVIWFKEGQTHSLTATLWSGDSTLRAVHVRRWGTSSTRPLITTTAQFYSPGLSGGFLLDDIDVTGNDSSIAFGLTRTGAGDRGDWDVQVTNSTIQGFIHVLFASDDQWNGTNRTTLGCSFVAFHDSVFTDQTQYHIYASNAVENLSLVNVTLGPNNTNSQFRLYSPGEVCIHNCSFEPTDNDSTRFIGGTAENEAARFISISRCSFYSPSGLASLNIECNPSENGTFYFRSIRVADTRLINFVVQVQCATGGGDNTANIDQFELWNCWGNQVPSLQQRTTGASAVGITDNVRLRNCCWIDRAYGGGAGILSISGAKANWPDDAIEMTGCVGYWAVAANPEPRYAIMCGESITAAEAAAIFALESKNHAAKVNGDAINWVRASGNVSLATWQGTHGHGTGSTVTLNTTLNLTNNGVADVTLLDVHLTADSGPLSNSGYTYGYAVDADGFLRSATTPDAGPFEFGASTTPDEPPLTPTGAMSGSSAGAATATGTLVGIGALAGSAAGAATASGVLVGTGALVGSAAGSATASGTLVPLEGGGGSATEPLDGPVALNNTFLGLG